MKLGIETAFNRANDAGGINGRMLRLIAADDAYDPDPDAGRDDAALRKGSGVRLHRQHGHGQQRGRDPLCAGAPRAFFAPYSGSAVVRHDPPDRYVFNYRASYAEETAAIVRYLMKVRRHPGETDRRVRAERCLWR